MADKTIVALTASGARTEAAASVGKPRAAPTLSVLVAAGYNQQEAAWRESVFRRGVAARRRGDETLAAGLAHAIAQLDRRVATRQAKKTPTRRLLRPPAKPAPAPAPRERSSADSIDDLTDRFYDGRLLAARPLEEE